MRALLLVLSVGCVDADRYLVFLPTQVDAYTLPGNRIPQEELEEIALTSSDGTRIFAMLASATSTAPAMLFLHGQAENIDEAWGRTMALYDLGYQVLVLDYRGYGKSEGEPSEDGLYLDAQAGFDLLLARGIPRSRLVIVGFSMGTGVASHLAATNDSAALVLAAPFTSMRAIVEGSFPGGIPPGWVSEVEMDTLARISSIGAPLVVAHGDDDDRIPFRMGEEVFRHAAEPKKFLRLEGVDHAGLIEAAAPAIGEALETLLGPM
jgi:uncharacterized protein